MNSTGSISKEQDLIFYDNTTPALTTEDVGYFPIETVIGVGQVKSVIRDTQELKKALLDLSEVKKIRDEMRHCSVYWRCQDLFNGRDSYQINNPYDQVFTFLICEKIDFDITSDDIDHYYSDNNIPDHLKHNVILDISNGIYAYRTGDNMGFVGMPSSNKTPKPDFIGDDGSDIHFFHFLTNISIFISNNTVYHPDMGTYLSPGREPRREL